MSIFQTIRTQLADNNAKGVAQVLKLMGDYGYPTKVLNWLFKQGVLKIDGKNVKKVKEKSNYDRKVHTYYYIPYYDFDQSNKFCSIACDIAENELIRKDKAGYFSNEPVTTKFGKINDKYRAELECPNGTFDYKYESGTEMIDPMDKVNADFAAYKFYKMSAREMMEEYGDAYFDMLREAEKNWDEVEVAPEYVTGSYQEVEEEGV